LIRRGQTVVATHWQTHEALDALRRSHPDALQLFSVDVRQEAHFRSLAAALAEQESRCQRVFYNAAIHLERERPDIVDTHVDDVTQTFDVNCAGAVRALKHLRPLLDDGGQLVLISSEAGSIGQCSRESEYGYCMSKSALNMLACLMFNREQRRGSSIDVRAIHPGWLRTDMGGPHAHDSAEEAAEQLLEGLQIDAKQIYTDRHGNPLPW
jgi:NAD(P)-dependent dehydrogenase (short-subunit alcohol dehydrogenase family)